MHIKKFKSLYEQKSISIRSAQMGDLGVFHRTRAEERHVRRYRSKYRNFFDWLEFKA